MEATEIVRLVLGITGSIAQVLASELATGNTRTLDVVRSVLTSPEDLSRVMEAEIAAQRAKAARELRP